MTRSPDPAAGDPRQLDRFAEHLLSFRRISDVQLRPQGDCVAYVLESADRLRDVECAAIWFVDVTEPHPRALTPEGKVAISPRWSPDGERLAYLETVEGTPQLFLVARTGGAARQLTFREQGAGTPVWAPDGSGLLFAATVESELKPAGMDSTRWQQRPKVVTRSRYKQDGMGFLMGRSTCVFWIPAGGGDPVQLTEAIADHSGICVAPDGRAIAFARTRTGSADGHITDLYRLELADRRLSRLTRQVRSVQSPAWSPNGRSIAFYGASDPGDSMLRVFTIDAEGHSEERPLTSPDVELATFPLCAVSPPLWTAEGDALLALLVERGATRITRLPLEGPPSATTSAERQIMAFSACRQRQAIAYVWSDAQLGGALCWLPQLDNGEHDSRVLTDVNAAWSGRRLAPRIERREFPRARGGGTDGFLLSPQAGDQSPRPLLLHVHGGPGSFTEFDYAYHPHWSELVARGWLVLSLNSVGSSSYTRAFFEELRGRWGERDLPDILTAIDALVQEGLVDPERIAIAGKSYGGFLAAYAVAHSRRFAAAVAGAPVVDLQSHYGTSDTGYYVDAFDMRGDLHEARETYLRCSPLAAVDRVHTPTLIMQGEDDQRCPVGQSEQLFQGLMRAGNAPAELVLYPNGDHHFPEQGTPSHRADYWTRMVGWLERWCGGPAAIQRA